MTPGMFRSATRPVSSSPVVQAGTLLTRNNGNAAALSKSRAVAGSQHPPFPHLGCE